MKKLALSSLIFVVAIAATCVQAVDIPAGDVDALLTAIRNQQSPINLAAGVYDLTGKTPISPKDVDSSLVDTRKAYLLVYKFAVTMVGANSKHWSEKTPEEETVIKCDNATARLVYGYTGGGRSSVFKHITFEGGNASGDNPDGGAILFCGTEFVRPYTQGYATNCVFRNCSAARNGGATIDVNAYDCHFVGNSAQKGGAAYGECANSQTTAITNDFVGCVFEGNCSTSENGGGALYLSPGGRVEGCTFITNSAPSGYGAAVHVVTPAPTRMFRDCRFIGNEAGRNGGAVYADNFCAGFADCAFTNNVAPGGGAVFADSGIGSVTNCVFSGNRAPGGSGGGAFRSNKRTDHLVDSVFVDNLAHFAGGAILASMHGIGELRGCVFTGNSSTNHNGGALYIGAEQASGLYDCTFTGNYSKSGGGAICFASVGFSTMSNCQFIANTSTASGASFTTPGYTLVTGCSFVSNVTDAAGCAGAYSPSMAASGRIENTLFDNNTNRFSNVGSHVNYAKEIVGCTFRGYGDLFCPKIERCHFDGAKFFYNNYGGGMIFFNTTTGTGYLRNCLFTHCDANVLVNNSTGANVEISNCTFADNLMRKVVNIGNQIDTEGYLLYAFRGGTDTEHSGMARPSTNLIQNCVFWRNYDNERTEAKRKDVKLYTTATSVFTPAVNILDHSVYGHVAHFGNNPVWGEGNIADAPQIGFAGESGPAYAALPYYSIIRKSPARNMGVNLDWMTLSCLDFAGNPRICDDAVDMGCYECGLPPTGTTLLVR